MPIRILLPIVTLLLTCSLAGAEMYKWVDEHGVVTFKDTPPPATKKGKKVKVYTDGDFAPAPSPQPVSTPRRATPAPQPAPPVKQRFTGMVELYVTDWCGYCKRAERYLRSKGVSYVAYDIEKDSAAMQRHKDLGGRGVPLIVVGSHKISGFSPETIDYYLENGR